MNTSVRSNRRIERTVVARGYLLLGIFYVHALYGVFESLGGEFVSAPASGVQIKILAPLVSAFFFLSGMAAPYFHRKGWRALLKPSLTLLLLAAVSHVGAVILGMLIEGHWYGLRWFAHRMLKPLVMGTGYESFVAWYFVVLAFARLFAGLFQQSKVLFFGAAVVVVAVIWLSVRAGLPDNLYEWRNWPTATCFFLLGMRIPGDFRPGPLYAWASLVGTVLLAWLNRPELLTQGLCRACDLEFVAQPMVGQYGSLPAYVLQQILFMIFLLWAADWSRDKMPGYVASYFGRDSLSMLLLHGWVLVTLYPIASRSLPSGESVFLFVSILGAAMLVHALLYFWLHPIIRWCVLLAFRASDWLLSLPGLRSNRRQTTAVRARNGSGGNAP